MCNMAWLLCVAWLIITHSLVSQSVFPVTHHLSWFCPFNIPEDTATATENGLANGNANGHASGSPVANGSIDVTPTSSESREESEKLSVLEVFKKVAVHTPLSVRQNANSHNLHPNTPLKKTEMNPQESGLWIGKGKVWTGRPRVFSVSVIKVEKHEWTMAFSVCIPIQTGLSE